MMQFRRNKPQTYKVGTFVLLAILVIVFVTSARGVVAGGVVWVIQPVLAISRAAHDGFFSFVQTFSSTRTLIAENSALKTELHDLKMRLLDRNILAEENAQLRELMGQSPAGVGVLGSVLSGPGSAPYDTLIVDAGTDDGIQDGDRVFVGENVIIGTVSATYAHSSQVTLLSAPGEKSDVVIVGGIGTDAVVIATGRGGGNFEVLVPRDTGVATGTPVLAAGTSRIIGIVEGAEGNANDPFKKLLLRTPINPQSIRFVRIVSSRPLP